MTPEEIEQAEFFVGMRGYEKSEVRSFLAEIANEQRLLLSRVALLESASPTTVERDPIDELGRQVTAVVRSAQEAGQALVAEAELAAADVRAAAERDAQRVSQEAAAIAEAADAQRALADQVLAEAREEADRIVAAAHARAQAEADELVAQAEHRQAQIASACDDMLNRLNEAVTGAQMSLLVLRPETETPDPPAAPTAAESDDASPEQLEQLEDHETEPASSEI